MKKYELTTNTKMMFGRTLFQIRALISFGNVTAGELGGYVEKEDNLAHDGNAWVYGNAEVCGNAKVCGNEDYLVIGPIGSRAAFTTFYRRDGGEIMVVCGCFHGTIDEFEKKVDQTHSNNDHAKAYHTAAQLARIRMRSDKEA